MKKRLYQLLTAMMLAAAFLVPAGCAAGGASAGQESGETASEDENERALERAKYYMFDNVMLYYSREGLIRQLKIERFSQAVAEYGADNCGADWKESAVKAAKSKQEYSRGTMINLLKNLGFTYEEAAYAADYYHK